MTVSPTASGGEAVPNLVLEAEELDLLVELLSLVVGVLLGLHGGGHRADHQLEYDEGRDQPEGDEVDLRSPGTQSQHTSSYKTPRLVFEFRVTYRADEKLRLGHRGLAGAVHLLVVHVAAVHGTAHELRPVAFRRRPEQREKAVVEFAEVVRVVGCERVGTEERVGVEQHAEEHGDEGGGVHAVDQPVDDHLELRD